MAMSLPSGDVSIEGTAGALTYGGGSSRVSFSLDGESLIIAPSAIHLRTKSISILLRAEMDCLAFQSDHHWVICFTVDNCHQVG